MCRFVLDVNDHYGTTIVLIEHDMGVVMDISDRVVVLDYGRKISDGTPDEVREDVKRRLEVLGEGGGFVFATIHNIQHGVPAENLTAMFETLRSFRR